MPAPVLLLVSVGRTDLQACLRGPNGPILGLIAGDVRAAHEGLLAEPDRWSVGGEVPNRGEPGRAPRLEWQGGALQYPPEHGVMQDAEGRVRLVAPKLQPIVDAITEDPSLSVGAVIVFSTARDSGRYARQEPVALGPVLSVWLAERFGLATSDTEGAVGRGRSGWVAVLRDDDPLVVADDPQQQQVTHKASDRIDDAIARAVDSFDEPPDILLSTGGGIPGFKPIIEAAARLRGAQTRLWVAPEDTTRGRWLPAEAPAVTPRLSLAVRRQALERVRVGDFIGALSVIPTELRADGHERGWITVIERIASWFAGLLDPADASLPALSRVCGRTLPEALVPAMRAEAALVGGRWLHAIRQTATFGDVALRDAIRRHPKVRRFDPYSDEIEFTTRRPPVPHSATSPAALARRRRRGRTQYWRAVTMGAARGEWIKRIEAEVDPALGRALDALERAHTNRGNRVKIGGRALEPRRLRNTDAHAILPVELVGDACRAFEGGDLWQPNAPPGERFLGSPRVAEVLHALGVVDAPDRYRALVADIRAVILAHRLVR